MFQALQIVTVVLISVAMALSLAHALEFPGKRRLAKEAYHAMQPIYYPGFTIGGAVGEYGGLLLLIILLLLTPRGSANFWLTLAAVLGVIGMQTIYWIVTHPVNRVWLKGEELGRFGTGFFSFGSSKSSSQNEIRQVDWTVLRDRWEYSHVARAVLAMSSFILLVIAVSL